MIVICTSIRHGRLRTGRALLFLSFRCDTDSPKGEGFATASTIFDYVPGPSAAIDYKLGGL